MVKFYHAPFQEVTIFVVDQASCMQTSIQQQSLALLVAELFLYGGMNTDLIKQKISLWKLWNVQVRWKDRSMHTGDCFTVRLYTPDPVLFIQFLLSFCIQPNNQPTHRSTKCTHECAAHTPTHSHPLALACMQIPVICLPKPQGHSPECFNSLTVVEG